MASLRSLERPGSFRSAASGVGWVLYAGVSDGIRIHRSG
jgi:hypothetical protein